MSYRFIKMAAVASQYCFRFRICWYRCLQKVKVYQQTKFRRHISIYGWDMSSPSVLEKQTSAILKFSFRFLSWPFRRNMHVILHQPAEFRPNRSTDCENMTYYLFFKMAAAATQYYFRFRICWCHCLQKVEIYQCTKFRRHISIRGWIIIISGSEKQTSAIL